MFGLLLTQQFAAATAGCPSRFVLSLSFSLLSLCPTPGFDWVVCGTTEGLDAFIKQWLKKTGCNLCKTHSDRMKD